MNSFEALAVYTYMRHIAIDQKSNELPHPAVANVQTDNPTPISLKGLWLQGQQQQMRTYKANYTKIPINTTKRKENQYLFLHCFNISIICIMIRCQ